MKNIKVILAAAAVLVAFSSCTKRDFTVETGNTPVEFVPMDSIEITGEYYSLPIQMTSQSDLAAVAEIEVVSCTGVMINDAPAVLENDTDIIFTSQRIYIGAYDPDVDAEDALPTNNLELRIPGYARYKEIKLELKLVGENVGPNSSMVYNFKVSSPYYNFSGIFQIGQNPITVTATEDPLVYNVSLFGEKEAEWTASRAINKLTFGATTYTNAAGEACQWFPYDGQYISPGSASDLEWLDDDNLTTNTGIACGYDAGGGSYQCYILQGPGAAFYRLQ